MSVVECGCAAVGHAYTLLQSTTVSDTLLHYFTLHRSQPTSAGRVEYNSREPLSPPVLLFHETSKAKHDSQVGPSACSRGGPLLIGPPRTYLNHLLEYLPAWHLPNVEPVCCMYCFLLNSAAPCRSCESCCATVSCVVTFVFRKIISRVLLRECT